LAEEVLKDVGIAVGGLAGGSGLTLLVQELTKAKPSQAHQALAKGVVVVVPGWGNMDISYMLTLLSTGVSNGNPYSLWGWGDGGSQLQLLLQDQVNDAPPYRAAVFSKTGWGEIDVTFLGYGTIKLPASPPSTTPQPAAIFIALPYP
jgi:hypothetical protein